MICKTVLIAAVTLVYLWQTVLNLLKRKSASNPVPENVADVYDRDTYEKWKAYHAEKCRIGMISDTVAYAVDLLLILFDVYAAFAALFPQTLFMQMFAVLLLSALTGIFILPVNWIDTMVIEEKYGFNRSGKKTFFADQAKGFVLSLAVMTGIGSLLIWVHRALGGWLVPAFALLMTFFALLITFLYPFFSRIFNKFTPLEEGVLKDKLTAMLEKHGYTVRAIQIMDASRRSTRSNAYFTGFGRMKTIVLYDTLAAAMSDDEICAVFAHEMGHGLHKDTLKNGIMNFLRMLVIAVMAYYVLDTREIFLSCGFEGINYGFAIVPVITAGLGILSPLMGLVSNALSRRAEYRADEQAVREGYAECLISALKKLSRDNFSDLSPDRRLVLLEYSHPTLSQRIDAIRRKEGEG